LELRDQGVALDLKALHRGHRYAGGLSSRGTGWPNTAPTLVAAPGSISTLTGASALPLASVIVMVRVPVWPTWERRFADRVSAATASSPRSVLSSTQVNGATNSPLGSEKSEGTGTFSLSNAV